ncbi:MULTISPECIES: CaiB/BaiF CoA transferase family protein [Sphingomonas]|uniref:CaiB/BaiF CoA transferase family protein n=1 Tax=Sphingomonas TaxID=13687 RepID=UPI000DEF4843|nr:MULTISPECIES: CaiB/BaiF CoA-transferase family protein [Sphingomonas]
MSLALASRGGPLSGIRVVEFAGLGPTPFAGMMLADYGAEVLRIERAGAPPYLGAADFQVLNRSRPSIELDLKQPAGAAFANELLTKADILLEGYRPGVMERLGFGPTTVCAANPKLIYARMSGWGQEGELATLAGHDINYLAMSGALHAIGPAGAPPVPPLNLVADFGGGGMLVFSGILAALVERASSGRGQVIDAAMLDGSALLFAQIAGWQAAGVWHDRRGHNLLDGSAYFYRCYATADAKFIAVGALEQQFHDALLSALGLEPEEFGDRLEPAQWDARSALLAERFRTRTRDEWVTHFAGIDACVSPVLSLEEAEANPANAARRLYVDGEPSAAPRFSRTPAERRSTPGSAGQGGAAALRQWGMTDDQWRPLRDEGLLRAE